MPYDYQISETLRRVRVTARGKVDFSGGIAIGVAIREDDQFHADYSFLVDLREMDFVPSNSEIQDFALSLSALKEDFRGPTAVLSRGGFIFGLVRMTCLLADRGGLSIGAFQDEAEAVQWLNSRSQGLSGRARPRS